MFKKSELVTGDILVMRNGERYVVMKTYGERGKDTFLKIDTVGWCDPSSFNDDLSCTCDDHYDVMKVLRPIKQSSHFLHKDNRMAMVFDRDTNIIKLKKCISKQDACDELGRLYDCEVEIY